MINAIKLIFGFICLRFVPHITRDSKTVLLIFQSPQNGGTHTYFKYITEYLAQRGLSIHLLVCENEIDESVLKIVDKYSIKMTIFTRGEIYQIFQRKGQSLKSWIYFILHALKQIIFLLNIYRTINPKFTYISVGYPFIWFVGLYIPGKIYYIQHVMPLHPLDSGNRLILKCGLLFKFKSLKFIAVSDFCRNKMAENWGILVRNTEVIYNYFDGTDTARISSDKIRILSLARADEARNPVLFAELGNIITDLRDNVIFVWAGSGDALGEAKARVKNHNKVQFIGHRNDVPELYANSDIYFNPANREAHGISVVGAMCYGLPVVATNNGGTVESVLDGETGFLVDVANKDQMIDRLLQLIDNKMLRIEMGRKAKLRFEQLFTAKIWSRKMDNLLKENFSVFEVADRRPSSST
ncbi:MAG: glycosyltransferase family 4 protein [bacterium]